MSVNCRLLTVDLKGVRQFAPTPDMSLGSVIAITRSSGEGHAEYLASFDGQPLGLLALRRDFRAMLEGEWAIFAGRLTHLSPAEERRSAYICVSVFYARGAPTQEDLAWVERFDPDPPMRSYPVPIVGEGHYQPAIASCAVGDTAEIAHEIGNPFDNDALVVKVRGERVGYIGRDHWLQDAVHDEGKTCLATVGSVTRAEGGNLAMVLALSTTPGPIAATPYSVQTSTPAPTPVPAAAWIPMGPAAAPEDAPRGFWARLFG